MPHRADDRTATRRAVIAGTGSCAPAKKLTNEDLAQFVDTNDEWIRTRTGIRTRRIAEDHETTATLASEASRRALEAAGVKPEAIEMIVLGTITPEMVFPSTACFVQDAIGATNAWAFDVAAACSGFVYGLSIAQQFIENGQHENVLVIGAETLSRITNWKDRTSCILFGDAAGAAVIRRGQDGQRGLLYSTMSSDGRQWQSLSCPAYGSRNPVSRPLAEPDHVFMQIKGREVYQYAVRRIVESVEHCLEHCGLDPDDVSMVVSHQMNARIIESAAKRLSISPEKFFINIDRYGNTSAASVPLAIDECVRGGRIKRGDIVVLVAFGGGFTWGANVLEY